MHTLTADPAEIEFLSNDMDGQMARCLMVRLL